MTDTPNIDDALFGQTLHHSEGNQGGGRSVAANPFVT